MNEMLKFLEVVAANHLCGAEFGKNAPRPDEIMEMLEEIVSPKLLQEIDDLICAYSFNLSVYSVARGLKVAIEIIDGTYCPEG